MRQGDRNCCWRLSHGEQTDSPWPDDITYLANDLYPCNKLKVFLGLQSVWTVGNLLEEHFDVASDCRGAKQ